MSHRSQGLRDRSHGCCQQPLAELQSAAPQLLGRSGGASSGVHGVFPGCGGDRGRFGRSECYRSVSGQGGICIRTQVLH